MPQKKMILIAAVLLVGAVIAVIAAEQMHLKAEEIVWIESISRGNQLHMVANIIKYSGFAAGAVGVVLLLAGFLRKND